MSEKMADFGEKFLTHVFFFSAHFAGGKGNGEKFCKERKNVITQPFGEIEMS